MPGGKQIAPVVEQSKRRTLYKLFLACQRYLQFKRDMQALVQAKLARFNALFLQKLKAEGRNAAQKFWNYVRIMDRTEQSVQLI
ncbi:hypothetical protein MRX96_002883 [Rhipicephalus microplus]